MTENKGQNSFAEWMRLSQRLAEWRAELHSNAERRIIDFAEFRQIRSSERAAFERWERQAIAFLMDEATEPQAPMPTPIDRPTPIRSKLRAVQ